jgi:hypothetical protein
MATVVADGAAAAVTLAESSFGGSAGVSDSGEQDGEWSPRASWRRLSTEELVEPLEIVWSPGFPLNLEQNLLRNRRLGSGV